MSEKPILEVRHLSKRFDGNGVLKDVSFAMAEGAVWQGGQKLAVTARE